MNDLSAQNTDRKKWMSLLAKAPEGRAAALLGDAATRPGFNWLRAPEIGSVMVRGRMGGTGDAFNMGEMTVTRCALKLGCGTVGHGYVQGRRKACAETAALIDALMQTQAASRIQAQVLDPLAHEAKTRQTSRADKAAATKVDFFTMTRGED